MDTPAARQTTLEDPGAAATEDAVVGARAQEICANLLIQRWLPKRAYRDLLIDDTLRGSVERRLAGVGLALVDSYTSSYFAVRLLSSVESDVRLDWATNARLQRGAVALVVILWTRLVLPRRVASDEARRRRQEGEDQTAEGNKPERLPSPTVARTALFAEFGERFGKTGFARYLGQLKAAGFVLENRQGQLREGPLLDNLVDGVTMARKLRDSVLWDLLAKDGHDLPADQELTGLAAASAPSAAAGTEPTVEAADGAADRGHADAPAGSDSDAGDGSDAGDDGAVVDDGDDGVVVDGDDDFADWGDD